MPEATVVLRGSFNGPSPEDRRRAATGLHEFLKSLVSLDGSEPFATHAAGHYFMEDLMRNPGGREMEQRWHGRADAGPRGELLNQMRQRAVFDNPDAVQFAERFARHALSGHRPPPHRVADGSGEMSSFDPSRNLITMSVSDMHPLTNYPSSVVFRHEMEHSRQPRIVGVGSPERQERIDGGKEIGPVLGDIIHAGSSWLAAEPHEAASFKVPLSKAYQPSLGWMLKQAIGHGYPTTTMDDILDSEPGRAWLKMRIGEHAPKSGDNPVAAVTRIATIAAKPNESKKTDTPVEKRSKERSSKR